jgi:vancomycin permeability regulator SanA
VKKKNKIIPSAIVIIVFVFQLLFLYYVKYNNQKLSVDELSLLNIGNILNLFSILVIILGIVVYTFQRVNQTSLLSILTWTSLITLILAAAYYSTIISLPFKSLYFLGQNGNKLFVGLLFAFYLLLSFGFASYIWLGIFGRHNLRLLRSILNSLLISFALLIFSFYYVIVSDPRIDDKELLKNKNNVAVVLGAAVWSKNVPSPILAYRVDKALHLLEQKIVGKIQLTGGNAPGELSEAEVAFRYAINKGADSSNFMIESKTSTTNEQIQFIRKELLPNKDINQVLIVSDKFHLVRIEEISKFNKLKIHAVSSDLKLSFESDLYNRLRESIGLLFFWFFAI